MATSMSLNATNIIMERPEILKSVLLFTDSISSLKSEWFVGSYFSFRQAQQPGLVWIRNMEPSASSSFKQVSRHETSLNAAKTALLSMFTQ